MTFNLALMNDLDLIVELVHSTINEVYKKYYPLGAVEYFINYHSSENIRDAIDLNEVYLLLENENVIGTISIHKNEIGRLFILPTYQGKGFGSKALEYFEKLLFEKYDTIELSSSFPAYSLYEKRGYVPVEYNKILTDNGDYLCYHLMRLTKSN